MTANQGWGGGRGAGGGPARYPLGLRLEGRSVNR